MSSDDKGPTAASDCTPASPGLRNRYFRGKLLTVADYEAEQRYAIQRRRLINREMLGWGIVSGFAISPDDDSEIGPGGGVEIGEGLAFDPRGREIVACTGVRIRGGADVVWLACGRGGLLEPAEPPKEPDSPPHGAAPAPYGGAPPAPATEGGTGPAGAPGHPGPGPAQPAEGQYGGGQAEAAVYLLSAHYAERLIDGVVVRDECGEEVSEANRICETVVYSLCKLEDACPEGLSQCPVPPWDTDECDMDFRKWSKCGAGELKLADVSDRGPHSTLVRWSLDRAEGKALCREPALVKIGDGLAIDPEGGVPLACVAIGYHCCNPYIARVADAVGPRRLARRNDTLFNLIRGCDLTRIGGIGWRPFYDEHQCSVPFATFAEMFVGGRPDQKIRRPSKRASGSGLRARCSLPR